MLEDSLPRLRAFVQECQADTSSNAKKEILARYPDLKEIFQYVYNPYINFYTSSDNVQKQRKALQSEGPDLFGGTSLASKNSTDIIDLKDLLDKLSARTLSGFDGIRSILKIVNKNKLYEDLIFMILDKDLKVRIDVKSINKVFPNLIPTFNVALAKKYQEVKDKVNFTEDRWLASRKLDGLRCITVIDENGKITCYTRTGNEFKTLGRVIDEIKRIFPELRKVVFDGELCILDEQGNEHFDWIQKEWNKDNHTIAMPQYKIFDLLALGEFTREESDVTLMQRLSTMSLLFAGVPASKCRVVPDHEVGGIPQSKILVPLEHTVIRSAEHLEELSKLAEDQKWEGLIIRKDCGYEGKRTSNLLKVKTFEDMEVVVEGVVTGPFRYVKNNAEAEEEMLTAIYFTFNSEKTGKSNRVDVGSGFKLEQRQRFFLHPEEIIGKTIKIHYFEETINQSTGLPSLRFPTLQYIYENGRDE